MHAMIDLETLNVGASAPIFEIGVCFFDLDRRELVSSTQWNVDLLDVILTTGFCPNQETIKWWQEQAYDPRSLPRVSLIDALGGLSAEFENNKAEKVWANSPSFDCVLLQRHYEACKMPVPWRYSQELDFRTIRWMSSRWDNLDYVAKHVSHNAREDAVAQTEMLFEMIKGLDHAANIL